MRSPGKQSGALRLTTMAMLTGFALIIFGLELAIPPLVPIPGVKLGLANIVTVYAMFALGPLEALGILLARIVLGSILTGQGIGLMYSLAGGMCCYAAMLSLRPFLEENQIWVASVFGAMAHNGGQMTMALVLTQTPGILAYLPILMVSGMVTGTFTGLWAQGVVRRVGKKRFQG